MSQLTGYKKLLIEYGNSDDLQSYHNEIDNLMNSYGMSINQVNNFIRDWDNQYQQKLNEDTRLIEVRREKIQNNQLEGILAAISKNNFPLPVKPSDRNSSAKMKNLYKLLVAAKAIDPTKNSFNFNDPTTLDKLAPYVASLQRAYKVRQTGYFNPETFNAIQNKGFSLRAQPNNNTPTAKLRPEQVKSIASKIGVNRKIFNKEAFAIRISANNSSDIIRLINLYWYSIDSPKFFSGGFRILTEVFPESQKDNSIVLNSQELYLLLFDTDFIEQRVRPIHNLVSREQRGN